jgi:hypothetical protein
MLYTTRRRSAPRKLLPAMFLCFLWLINVPGTTAAQSDAYDTQLPVAPSTVYDPRSDTSLAFFFFLHG